ncbi:hypothetical protein, partial [uncultured Brevundimonas sp.]|uniref:hypothetical protein n=1 Tax=uncultured Brevundimonas sp. TaxID=213418 RepID=UPI00262502CF
VPAQQKQPRQSAGLFAVWRMPSWIINKCRVGCRIVRNDPWADMFVYGWEGIAVVTPEKDF